MQTYGDLPTSSFAKANRYARVLTIAWLKRTRNLAFLPLLGQDGPVLESFPTTSPRRTHPPSETRILSFPVFVVEFA
ncbi:hypothetical protein Y032_1073g3545 [Ancylostoma ceylanicum]|uniref:Uncharacterized protein n=1 Tax=Ancylostoma ceylanicum TaxID=53326 RepID=A0A016W6T5_9BILA|nr:hypothetical protein Y032_1073g3545 [Ancylostoma ceylanicum]